MKRYGAFIALGMAVLFGATAVVLTHKWLAGQVAVEPAVAGDVAPTSRIVVAAQNIPVGSRLSADNLVLVDWPRANVPKGAFDGLDPVVGRIAVTQLVAGEPLLAAELAAPGSGAGLVAIIEPGMRAMAIQVDEVTGVGGFILPSSYVDVIGVEKVRRNTQKANTILTRIKVLATAQDTFNEEGKAKVVRTVTLAVKPDQAETLALQTHKGSIHLVLRNPLEEEPPPPPKRHRVVHRRVYKPKPQPFDVEVIRGGQRDTVRFKELAAE